MNWRSSNETKPNLFGVKMDFTRCGIMMENALCIVIATRTQEEATEKKKTFKSSFAKNN